MEEHKALKQILRHSAEGAPDDFTDAVMKKINRLSPAPVYYQPLVPPKIVKGFIIAAGALVALILVLCLIISVPYLPYPDYLAEDILSQKIWNKVLTFIFCFWFVFAVNGLIEKKKRLFRNAMLF